MSLYEAAFFGRVFGGGVEFVLVWVVFFSSEFPLIPILI